MKYKIALIFTVLFLTGCATAPKSAVTFNKMEINKPAKGKGILVFYRVMTPPAAYDMHVFINDTEVVSLPNEAFSWVELDAGQSKLKIDWSNWSGMWGQEIDINIEPNVYNYIELTSSVGEGVVFDLINDAQYGVEKGSEDETKAQKAERQLVKCCRYVPSKKL